MNNDTIVAVATPHGVGGIAVVRISGPDALAIVSRHLSGRWNEECGMRKEELADAQNNSSFLIPHSSFLQPRHATYCRFDDLDDGIAVYYPRGYSGEPVIEFSCHGSLYVQQAIVQVLVDDGARLAGPGEFTMRAFRNGRMDLSQAEAVADLIDAATPSQHRLAVSQLRGGYADELKDLRQRLLDLTSLLELELDFSQEDVEFADRSELHHLLSTLHSKISELVGSFRIGNAIKKGIPVAIVGEPNAGKSTLLNALLNDDRAIVSPIPGTTRDTIEETIVIDGLLFRFIDTAGLHHSDDLVEQLGIERSLRAIEDAEIVLVVGDGNGTTDKVEWLLNDAANKCLLVVNKADLMSQPRYGNYEPGSACYYVSALLGNGIDELKRGIVSRAGMRRNTGDVLLSNVRHLEALQNVDKALVSVSQGLDGGVPVDLLAIDLRDALYHLGTITGEVTNDEILGNIFSRFCIGK